MKVGIILGYGIFQESNLQYKGYLDKALLLIEKEQPDYVMTTGGFSNKDFPELSEAKTVADYLTKQQPQLTDKVIMDEDALSTPQNLEFCAKILEEKQIKPDQIFITGDSIRATKAYFLALQIFNTMLNLEINDEKAVVELVGQQLLDNKYDSVHDGQWTYKGLTVQGFWIDRSLEETGYQITSTLLESFSLKYPDIHQKFIDWRKKQWGVK